MSGDFHAAVTAQGRAAGSAAGAVPRGVAIVDAATVIGEQCATCDGFMCLDCVEGVTHDRCTRTCHDCVIDTVDWDESMEASQIVTELRGLHAVEEAIAAMDDEQEEGQSSA